MTIRSIEPRARASRLGVAASFLLPCLGALGCVDPAERDFANPLDVFECDSAGACTGCPEGQHNDGAGACVDQGCADGFHDDGRGKCVSSGCAESFHDDGAGKCVVTGCATGFHWDAARGCLADTCPPGYVDDGNGRCVLPCATGLHDDATGKCVAAGCAPGYRDDGNGTCAKACAAGFHDDGAGKCVAVGCAPGFLYDGSGSCVTTCPAGLHDDGAGTCVASGCASGYEDDGTGTCVARDLEWANWPVPPETPADYSTTAETVTGEVTGLVWQRAVSGTAVSWKDAGSYCAGLVLAGKVDWRLPTAVELLAIVDSGRANPAINVGAFPGTLARPFWASTPCAGVTGSAWSVDFSYGDTGCRPTSESRMVRCVR